MSPNPGEACSSPRRVNIACAFTTSGHAVAMSTSLSENRAPRTVSEASAAARHRRPWSRPDRPITRMSIPWRTRCSWNALLAAMAPIRPRGGVGRHPKRSLEEATRPVARLPGERLARRRSPRRRHARRAMDVTSFAGLAELPCDSAAPPGGSRRSPRLREPIAGGRLELGGLSSPLGSAGTPRHGRMPEKLASTARLTGPFGSDSSLRIKRRRAGRPPSGRRPGSASTTSLCSKTRPRPQPHAARPHVAAAASRSKLAPTGAR